MRLPLLCFVVASLPLASNAQPDVIGRLLEKVVCEADESQSYALYVPSNYTRERKWPVIFCFDAGARGRIPVERLQAAAEKYGYIIAGSLTSRNGPWEANATAAQAMIRDVSAHFSTDPARLYTAGMSGGARVATAIALSGTAKGVIACGAGFPVLDGGIPDKVSFAYFGTVGTEDFNYAELRRLDDELAERKAPHRIAVFIGGHEWASAALLTEAVGWLTLQAMRAGMMPRDDGFVQTALQTRLAALPAQPGPELWREMKSLAADFAGLADTGEFAARALALGASREVKAGLKAERALAAREDELLNRLGNTALESATRRKALAEELRRLADGVEDSPERRMVRRVLASFTSMTRETVRGWFEQEEYGKAAAFLAMAEMIRPGQARTLYDLARARAFSGDKKGAVEALEQAATAGFTDAARAEAEPAFAKMHGDAGFQETLAKIRAGPPDPTLELPAMRVSAALASVELRLFYLPNAGTGILPLSFLRVERVRPGTTAALAGVEAGMEITAIQDRRVRGLSEDELHEIMALTVRKEIVLTVREPTGGEKELRLALRKPAGAAGAR